MSEEEVQKNEFGCPVCGGALIVTRECNGGEKTWKLNPEDGSVMEEEEDLDWDHGYTVTCSVDSDHDTDDNGADEIACELASQ